MALVFGPDGPPPPPPPPPQQPSPQQPPPQQPGSPPNDPLGEAGRQYLYKGGVPAYSGGDYGGLSTPAENRLRGSWFAGRYGGSMGGMNNELERADSGLYRGSAQNLRGIREEEGLKNIGTSAMRTGGQITGTGQAFAADQAKISQGYRDQGGTSFADNQRARMDTQTALDRVKDFYEKGPGPSAAEAQLRQAGDMNMGQALALARSGRGAGDNAASMRQAQFQNAATMQQTGGQLANLRAQESANWQQQKLSAMGLEQQGLSGMRGQDLAAAQQSNQTGLGYGQLGLQGGTEYGKLGLGYNQLGADLHAKGAGLGLGYAGLGESSMENAERLRQNILSNQQQADVSMTNADKGVATQMAGLNAQKDAAMIGGAATMGAGLLMLSDIRNKQDIVPMDGYVETPAMQLQQMGLNQPAKMAQTPAVAAPDTAWRNQFMAGAGQFGAGLGSDVRDKKRIVPMPEQYGVGR
jgi:hypothetical protein